MKPILAHAHGLVYTLMQLMPTPYQQANLQAMLGLFFQAQGQPLPAYSQAKSPSALSRFFNQSSWSTQDMIAAIRAYILSQLLGYRPLGCRPWLQVIVDLTTLEKRGKFKAFETLLSVLQGKRGLHLVVLYLVVGQWRVPWSLRVYRGKGSRSPAQLALRLIGQLPKPLTRHYRVMVLADTGFGSVEFIQGVRKLRHHLMVGVRCDRLLTDGRSVCALHKAGSQVQLKDLNLTVTIAWFYLKRDGKWQKRYVLSTRALKASTITWWGKRRWQIEGWFKTAKHRFGLHRFGQQTLQGMYRWLILSLTAYLLAHWAYLSSASSTPLIDWAKAAESALHLLLPQLVTLLLLLEVSRLESLLNSQGFEIHISRCKI
ncbi:MAG TPA: transposase [Coleofasciculaceae cyanobacterium]|jgi:hypothetical protein